VAGRLVTDPETAFQDVSAGTDLICFRLAGRELQRAADDAGVGPARRNGAESLW
jgi:hypothetical protein